MRRIAQLSAVIANVAVALGIFTFFLQRHEEDVAASQREAVQFFRDMQGGAIWQSRERIENALNKHDFAMFMREGGSVSDIDILVRKSLRAGAHTGIRQWDVAIISDYIHTVVQCVESGQCDEKTVRLFLGKYIRNFHCIFYPLMKAYYDRMSDADVMNRISEFVGGRCA